MATLETQYKIFLHKNPDSKFTYLEWLEWFSNSIANNLKDKLKQEANDSSNNLFSASYSTNNKNGN